LGGTKEAATRLTATGRDGGEAVLLFYSISLLGAVVALVCLAKGVQRWAAAAIFGLSLLVPSLVPLSRLIGTAVRVRADFLDTPPLVIGLVAFELLISFCVVLGAAALLVALARPATAPSGGHAP
jgi:hypothetical protein